MPREQLVNPIEDESNSDEREHFDTLVFNKKNDDRRSNIKIKSRKDSMNSRKNSYFN